MKFYLTKPCFHHHTDYVFYQDLKLFDSFYFSTAGACVFCIPSVYDPNWDMHLLHGIQLHWQICSNLTEFREFVALCCNRFLLAYVSKSIKMYYLDWILQHFTTRGSIQMPYSYTNKIICSSLFDFTSIHSPYIFELCHSWYFRFSWQ